MSRRHLLLPLSFGLLCACGGGENGGGLSSQGATRQITVDDNGDAFTYATTTSFAPTRMAGADLSAQERQLFDAVNAERARGGSCFNPATGQTVTNKAAAPLLLEKNIYAAARSHAAAMVSGNFEGHLNRLDAASRTPTRRIVGAGYKPLAPLDSSGNSLFFEESLAYGYLTSAEVIEAWKTESFSHCMTIYVPLTYGAVAVQDGLPGNKYTRYWVLNVSGEMPNS